MGRAAAVGDDVRSPEAFRVRGVVELVVEGLRGSLDSSVTGDFEVDALTPLLDGWLPVFSPISSIASIPMRLALSRAED
jgi:hypothetical protein